MAVGAFDPVDVVTAGFGGEGRVHFFDVEAAVGEGRVAVCAGGASAFAMSGVAGLAAKAGVYADGSAVVAGAGLRSPVVESGGAERFGLSRRMALVAKSLARIGAEGDGARSVIELGKG